MASRGAGGGDGKGGPIGSSRDRESGGGAGTQVENAGVDDVIVNAIAMALASDVVEREGRRTAREVRRDEKERKNGEKGRTRARGRLRSVGQGQG